MDEPTNIPEPKMAPQPQYFPGDEPLRQQEPMPPLQPGGPARGTSGMAIASLVLGICGIVLCPFFLSIPAMLASGAAKSDLRRRRGLSGAGMAQAGMILGIIGTAIGVVIIAVVIATGSWEDWETDSDSGSNRQQQEKVVPGIDQDYQLQ